MVRDNGAGELAGGFTGEGMGINNNRASLRGLYCKRGGGTEADVHQISVEPLDFLAPLLAATDSGLANDERLVNRVGTKFLPLA